MNENKCICVCLIPALISFVFCLCSLGIFTRLCLMRSSRPLRWLKAGDVTMMMMNDDDVHDADDEDDDEDDE